ncbi:GNAT family N-acetyltransferase [Halococcus salsus]|uniref:GNAT family N-acetyltransferase n=1 Tax=Halococcus salsus TaxID=2162894 RepID=UPI00135A81D6|nr:GNAT family protein [Halococcus salsus]
MPGPVFLEGEKVTLRPPEEEDVDLIQCWMNDPSVWRRALDVNPTSRQQCAEFIEDVLQGDDGVHCLACDDSAPLGLVSLNDSQYGPDETSRARDTELAYWFDPDHHGQGYGSDAARRMIQYAFEDRNFRRITARPGSFNDASVGLLESLGFTHEGTLREAAWFRGEYHDMLYYGLLREEWNSQ